eukprot:2080552-Rhodomonas_salina.4
MERPDLLTPFRQLRVQSQTWIASPLRSRDSTDANEEEHRPRSSNAAPSATPGARCTRASSPGQA